MSKYGLIKSFGIDGGELEGLRAQDCFVLGYELANIDHLLTTGLQIQQPVHADNRARIDAACRESGRRFTITWMPGDVSESWMLLEVAPR